MFRIWFPQDLGWRGLCRAMDSLVRQPFSGPNKSLAPYVSFHFLRNLACGAPALSVCSCVGSSQSGWSITLPLPKPRLNLKRRGIVKHSVLRPCVPPTGVLVVSTEIISETTTIKTRPSASINFWSSLARRVVAFAARCARVVARAH